MCIAVSEIIYFTMLADLCQFSNKLDETNGPSDLHNTTAELNASLVNSLLSGTGRTNRVDTPEQLL